MPIHSLITLLLFAMGCPSIVSQSIGEQCSYYAISAGFLILRGCVRLRTRGWRRLQSDDHIAVWVLFCVVTAGFFTVASLQLGGTWLFIANRKAAEKLLECQVERVRRGSIYNVLNW